MTAISGQAIALTYRRTTCALSAYRYEHVPILQGKAPESTRLKRHASHDYRPKLLLQLIHSSSEAEGYNGLQSWSRTLGIPTLDEWTRSGPAGLAQEIDIFARNLLWSGNGQVDRARLVAPVSSRLVKAQ
jgi:hypothetical protein